MLVWFAEHMFGRPAVGLDISDHAARFCRLAPAGRGGWTLALGEAALPEGAVVRGEVRQPAVLALTLRAWLDSPAGRAFRGRPSAVALPAAQSFTRCIDLPKLSPEEIDLAVRWEVEGVMSRAADELFYRYALLPSGVRPGPRRAAVTAVPQRIVAGYRRALGLAGIPTAGFEFGSRAAARAQAPRAAAPVAIAALGRSATQVTIAHRGLVPFAASLVTASPGGTLAGSPREHLAAELRHILWSWSDHPAARSMEPKGISAVYLAADGDSPGLARSLAASLSRPVLPSDPFVNLRLAAGHIPPVPRHEAPRFATAIGLAMGGIA